jgi:quercetin dioxygenase-like cupin family protein
MMSSVLYAIVEGLGSVLGMPVGISGALAPDDFTPWHYHSTVTDWYFCLGGTLRIEMLAPRGEEWLTPSGRYAIPPNTAHRISNGGNGEDCRFLLLQGVGVYDFNKITE